MDVWTDRQTDGRRDGRTDGRTDEQTDRQTENIILQYHFRPGNTRISRPHCGLTVRAVDRNNHTKTYQL